MNDLFRTFASGCAEIAGSAWVFIVVVVLTVIGAVITFATGFETWGLIVDPIIAATTFYLVILLQNSQNRDTKAMQLKLDELIRGVEGARTGMVDLENLSDDEMNRLQREFQRLREGLTTRTKTALRQSKPSRIRWKIVPPMLSPPNESLRITCKARRVV